MDHLIAAWNFHIGRLHMPISKTPTQNHDKLLIHGIISESQLELIKGPQIFYSLRALKLIKPALLPWMIHTTSSPILSCLIRRYYPPSVP